MYRSTARPFAFPLTIATVFLLIAFPLASRADAQKTADQLTSATFPQLFQASCSGTGGCEQDCLNGDDPRNNFCECAAGTASQWFTTVTTGTPSIEIAAAGANETYCRTVNTENTCQFDLGDGGVNQISFDFVVSKECSQSTVQGTEWLAFWMFNNPWNGHSEVDFIESRFGPSAGLNTNFDGNGHQVVVFPPGPATWTGSITATFKGTGNAVSVSVSNSANTNVGTTTLSSSTGYFFVMDTAGGSENSSCTITVSNLAVQGTVPSTLNGNANCVGLSITGG